MAARAKDTITFALASALIAIGGFWFHMEDYQKDRVATVIVRSIEAAVVQDTAAQQLNGPEAVRESTQGTTSALTAGAS